MLGWCRRLIGCRSVTGEGTRAIAELCARELLGPLGIETQVIESPSEGAAQVNLIASITGRDRALAPLVLNTHLDTVPPGDPAAWTECGADPFAAAIKGDRIYGLGSADTKLDFIAKVMGLAAVGQPGRDVWLVATFGEEHGLIGAKELTAAGRLPRGALAFIGEPSHLEVITAHKGLMVFELIIGFTAAEPLRGLKQKVIFEGRAAHSSTPALGRNAIQMAFEALAARPEIQVLALAGGDAVNKVPARCEVLAAAPSPLALPGALAEMAAQSDDRPIPHEVITAVAQFIEQLCAFADEAGGDEPDYATPTLTCNPGVISSSAEALVLDFELRPPPGLPLQVVRHGVDAIVERLAGDFRALRVELHERRANPGFRSDLTSGTVELAMAALARSGLPLNTGVKAGCTEAGIYAAAGLHPVVFGPGVSTGVIHAPNEHNLLSDVEGACRFYTNLMRA